MARLRQGRQGRARARLALCGLTLLLLAVPATAGADLLPPVLPLTAPTITATDPASPGGSVSPMVSGTAIPLATVSVFSDSACSVPLGTTTAGADGVWSLPIEVPANALTLLYAQASAADLLTGPASSSCSGPLRYVEDSTAPAEPVFAPLDPASPSSATAVTVAGQAEPGSRVGVYTDSECAKGAVAVLAAGSGGDWSALATPPLDTATTFYAVATDAAGNASACVQGPQFVQKSTAPEKPAAPASAESTTDPPVPPPLIPILSPPAPAPVQPDPGTPAPSQPTPQRRVRTVLLSNERTFTRWAGTRRNAVVRKKPAGASKGIVRLHHWNEDGAPEVYLALRLRTDTHGRQWVQLRLPMRPNGKTGWVQRSALGGLHLIHTRLVVDKRATRATLFRGGRRIWRANVGVGKPSTPTPSGHFWVRDLLRPASKNTIYGPYAFGTSAYSILTDWPGGGVVGIHGTNEPKLIPGRPSHGCVRVRNGPVTRLAHLMPIGTPVLIK